MLKLKTKRNKSAITVEDFNIFHTIKRTDKRRFIMEKQGASNSEYLQVPPSTSNSVLKKSRYEK